jgi:beta-lactam-binding protein with PASTA domain
LPPLFQNDIISRIARKQKLGFYLVGIVKTGFSAIGKLILIASLLLAFLVGLLGVVFVSLRGAELTVPEIVGKDFNDGSDELAQLGLKIKRRADRYSEEKPNTILEQLPKPGETVKTGQTVLVIVSRANAEGDEAPREIDSSANANSNAEGENKEKPVAVSAESNKPVKREKKANQNTNTAQNSNKKANQNSTSITNSNSGNKNANTAAANGNSSNSNSKNTNTNKPANSGAANNKNATNKPAPAASKTPAKPAVGPGDVRNRRIP